MKRALLLIIGLLLAADLAVLLIAPPSPQSGNSWPLILSVARGQGYALCDDSYFPFCKAAGPATAQREPLPVLAFAALALVTGESLWAAALFQVAVHAAIAIAVFRVATMLADRRTALLAAMMWAVYLPAMTLVNSVGGDLLATLFTTLGFALLLDSRQPLGAWLGAGLCFGLAALSRSVIMALTFPLVVASIPWKRLRTGPLRQFVFRDLRGAAVFTIVFLAVLSPWVIRNYLLFDRVVIGTTLVGYNLYRHNAVIQTDDYLRYVGPEEAEAEVKALLARRPNLLGTEDEAQMDRFYRGEALDIITTYPFRYLRLSAYRFFALWFDWGIPEAYGERRSGWDQVMVLQQALLLVAAVVGARKTGPRGGLLAAGILLVVLLHLGVNGRLRFLQVVMPVTVALGAIGVVVIYRWLTVTWSSARRRWEGRSPFPEGEPLGGGVSDQRRREGAQRSGEPVVDAGQHLQRDESRAKTPQSPERGEKG